MPSITHTSMVDATGKYRVGRLRLTLGREVLLERSVSTDLDMQRFMNDCHAVLEKRSKLN